MKHNPTKTSLILRIAASVYLLYLAWSLKDAPSSHIGMESILYIVAIAVFTIVAIIIGGMSIKAFAKGEYDMPDNSDGDKDQKEN